MPGKFVTTARVMQSCKSDWSTFRPGSTNDDKAWLIVRHVQMLSYSKIRNAGPNRLFRLLQGRDAREICAWCLHAEILLQAMWGKRCQHVSILNLNRRAVFKMHEQ